MKSSLKDFQKIFVQAILKKKNPSLLLEQIIPIAQLNGKEVLDLYRDDYRTRLIKSLSESFKACWIVLGDRDYLQAVGHYVETYPSSVKDLGQYGRNFPSFLRRSQHATHFPLIGDLAQLEWDFWQMFDRESSPYRNPWDTIEEASLPTACFRFHPTLKMYSWEMALYNIFKHRENPQITPAQLDCERPQFLILYKVGDQVESKELRPPQWKAIKYLREGKTLASAMENSSLNDPALIQDLFSFLRSSGLITTIL